MLEAAVDYNDQNDHGKYDSQNQNYYIAWKNPKQAIGALIIDASQSGFALCLLVTVLSFDFPTI